MQLNKEELIEGIADQLCEDVDQKTLLQLYYDDQVSYMVDMDDDELLEWAIDYLHLTKDEVLERYGDLK